MTRHLALALSLAVCAAALTSTGARASDKCENTAWNYCGRALDKCCPPERPYACINLRSPMQGQVVRGGPMMRAPRGWSGCVGPATPVSQAAWQNNCTRWVLCRE